MALSRVHLCERESLCNHINYVPAFNQVCLLNAVLKISLNWIVLQKYSNFLMVFQKRLKICISHCGPIFNVVRYVTCSYVKPCFILTYIFIIKCQIYYVGEDCPRTKDSHRIRRLYWYMMNFIILGEADFCHVHIMGNWGLHHWFISESTHQILTDLVFGHPCWKLLRKFVMPCPMLRSAWTENF
jgi:hypothetical protein